MEIETKQINITTIYQEQIINFAHNKTSEILNKFIEFWSKQPIIQQFPDFISIIEPTQQVNITIQNRGVSISNQEIKKFEGRDLKNFLLLNIETNKILEKEISAFGYNYIFLVTKDEDMVKIGKKIKKDINLKEMEIEEENFISGGLNLVYKTGDSRIQITATPQFAEDLNKPIAFAIHCNMHFYKNSLPPFSELNDSFEKGHTFFKEKLNSILN